MFGRKKKTESEKTVEEMKKPVTKEGFTEVDPRALISVPTILCPMCGCPMEIIGREEKEVTSRMLTKKTTKKIPHLKYQCTKDKTEFNLNLERRGGGCFIATAAFGTSMTQEINILRSFRDNVLMRESAGRNFISLYYRVSPTLAKMIVKSNSLRFITRTVLKPIVKAVQKGIDL